MQGNDSQTVVTSSSSETVKHSNMCMEESIRRYIEDKNDDMLLLMIMSKRAVAHIRHDLRSANGHGDEEIRNTVNEVLGDENQIRRVLNVWMARNGQFLPREIVVEYTHGFYPGLVSISDEDILQVFDELIVARNDPGARQQQQHQQQEMSEATQAPTAQIIVGEETTSPNSSLTGENTLTTRTSSTDAENASHVNGSILTRGNQSVSSSRDGLAVLSQDEHMLSLVNESIGTFSAGDTPNTGDTATTEPETSASSTRN